MIDDIVFRLRGQRTNGVLCEQAADEIERLEQVIATLTGEYGFIYADRIRWRDLSIRAYKEVFSIDPDHSDHKVWIEIEDAYEKDPD